MVKPIRTAFTLLAGYAAVRLASAATGQQQLLTDQNVLNFVGGGAASVYAIPKFRETLDSMVANAASDSKLNYKRMAKYAAFAGTGLAVAYAIEKDAPSAAGKVAKDLYDKHLRAEEIKDPK